MFDCPGGEKLCVLKIILHQERRIGFGRAGAGAHVKDSANTFVHIVLDDEIEKVEFVDVVGKGEVNEVFPSKVGAKVVDYDDFVVSSLVQGGDNRRADKTCSAGYYYHLSTPNNTKSKLTS